MVFHTDTHYSVFVKQNQPFFQKNLISGGECEAEGQGAVKGEFLHKAFPVVKTTTVEKIGKLSRGRCRRYVNFLCISTFSTPCGKLLWKNLWRLWKTGSYQQVFPLISPGGRLVENST